MEPSIAATAAQPPPTRGETHCDDGHDGTIEPSSTVPSTTDQQPQEKPCTFRKFRELLMLQRFANVDNLPMLVLPNLSIGSLGAAANLPGLEAARISHILCAAVNLPLPFPDRFVYEQLPLADTPTSPLDDMLPKGIAFIHTAITSGGSVLVHCLVGKSRSATIILGYLIQHHHMKLDDAMDLLTSARPKVQPNRGFLQQLRAFEAKIHTST